MNSCDSTERRDSLKDRRVRDRHRGRDFAFEQEIKLHIGRSALIAKYDKDRLVENRPIGNFYWLQLGIPLGHPYE